MIFLVDLKKNDIFEDTYFIFYHKFQNSYVLFVKKIVLNQTT